MKYLSLLFFYLFVTSLVASEKPNIVFILTDDLGYGDLSSMGAKDIETPNIDRIAEEGMKLNDFYVHNRCSPSRLAFMTGSDANRAGYNKVIYRDSHVGINSEEVTTPELLKQAGYKTGMVGKWHLGPWDKFNPTLHGFDYFYGFVNTSYDKKLALYENQTVSEFLSSSQTDGIYSPKLLSKGVKFIEEHKDQPFFLYYASPLPHTKWLPMEKFKGSSQQGTYGDVIQEIDWQVGVLLDTLDELDLTDNTLVIFASDNGPQLNVKGHGSAAPLRDGKWSNFEGGVRVPCFMRWPKAIKAKSENNEITAIYDLLPTFCEIANVKLPEDRVLDGKSILPYIRGDKVTEPIHSTFIVPNSTIRYKQWKLAFSNLKPGGKRAVPGAKAGELFNLKKDVAETTDLSAQYPEVVQEMTQLMNLHLADLKKNSRKIGTVPEDVEALKLYESKKSRKKKK